MGVYRIRHDDEDGQASMPSQAVALQEWLDFLETRRNALIMELRGIDGQLVKHGRIRTETLPRRGR